MSENDYKKYDCLKLFQQLREGHLDSTSNHFEVPQSRDLANASIPLKRRERRALKRKRKPENHPLGYICVSEKLYNILKENGYVE